MFDAALADDGYVSFKGPRHQAMAHIAMHDALNAIDPRYDQYAYVGRAPRANPVAAAAKAAHDVLVAVDPAQQARLDAELARLLATVPDGRGKTRAVTLGADLAAAIVALRQNDGTDVDLVSPGYTPGTRPGDYQFVPPYDFAFARDFRNATPFGLTSADQFRVPAPPPLQSRRYARAYNEVKSVGAVDTRPAPPTRATTPTGGTSRPRSAGPGSPASPPPARTWNCGARPACSRWST